MNLPSGSDTGAGDDVGNGTESSGTETAAVTPRIDRQKLDEIFGDVLPDTTADERDFGASSGYGEDWYRENRPPHHGG